MTLYCAIFSSENDRGPAKAMDGVGRNYGMRKVQLQPEIATHTVVSGLRYYKVAFVDGSRLVLTQPYPKYARAERVQHLARSLRISARETQILFDSITAVTLIRGGMEVESEAHTYRLLAFFDDGERKRRQEQAFSLIRCLDFVPESEDMFRFVPRDGAPDAGTGVEAATLLNRIADSVLRVAATRGISLSRTLAQLRINRPQPQVTVTFGRDNPHGGGHWEFMDFSRFRHERLGRYAKVLRVDGSPVPVQDEKR